LRGQQGFGARDAIGVGANLENVMIHSERHPHSWSEFPRGMPPLPESDEEIAHLGDETPIADIGTANHPVSTPPTAADVESAVAPPSRRYLWTGALAGILGAALAVSLAPFFIDTSARRSQPLPEVRIEGHAATPSGTQAAANDTPHEVAIDPVRIGSDAHVAHAPAHTASKSVGVMPSLVSASFPPFDVAAAHDAIAATLAHAAACGATGPAGVSITFAPSGKATEAVIETGSLRGTEPGSCVARTLRGAQIAPFGGPSATVHESVTLK
jgi:hypothetical protein